MQQTLVVIGVIILLYLLYRENQTVKSLNYELMMYRQNFEEMQEDIDDLQEKQRYHAPHTVVIRQHPYYAHRPQFGQRRYLHHKRY